MTLLENLIVAQHNPLMRASGWTVLGLFGAASYRAAERAAVERARYWLEQTGLTDRADDPAGDLPYGAQRRLEIARAMCTEPQLLCLDEPAAGLNPRETAGLTELLHSIRRSHALSILLIEHDMSVVMEHLRPRRGPRLRPEDRRRLARGRAQRPQGHRRLPRRGGPGGGRRRGGDHHDEARRVCAALPVLTGRGSQGEGQQRASDQSAAPHPYPSSPTACGGPRWPERTGAEIAMSEPLLVRAGRQELLRTIMALKGVDLDVHEGEIVTLIGANGAGKSTLMMTICGNPRAREGTHPLSRARHHPAAHARDRPPAHRPVAGRPAHLPAHDRAREPADGRRHRQRPPFRGGPRARLQAVPAARQAPRPARRYAVGRRAADAGHRPRPDEPAAAAAARRALARAGAHDRQADLRR